MNAQVTPAPPAEPELHLLPEWRDEERGRRIVWSCAGAAIVHVLLYFAAIGLNEYLPPPVQRTEAAVDLRKAVPLILPPDLLTQREPNQTKVAKEFNLENLTARPERKATPKIFTPPPSPPPGRSTTAPAPAPVIEAPKVNVAQAPNPLPGTIANLPGPAAPVPPPPPQPEQKPKLAFETPGIQSSRPAGTSRIEAPKSGIEEAMKSAARPGPGGVRVGDAGADADVPGGVGQLPGHLEPSPRQASSLELLSDPMGVDFKPYLIRVLAAVRRNWFAVIPESARFGRRGRVVLQFSISRTGSVPKLVIAMPSGTESFDRAAVAGISASNPFPPLPDGFHGDQIRLQMAFSYNMPSR